MAWIESHQELGAHPKTKKFARLLDVSRVTAVGHLQFLWWWATDYAQDGDLTKFDAVDIATGSEWEEDENAFLDALIGAGFVDRDDDGTITIHDWNDYAGKLIERRAANAKRMRDARATHDAPTKKERAPHVQRTQRARVELQNTTKPDTTKQDKTKNPPNPPNGGNTPFDLLVAMCEEVGQDVSVLSDSEKGKQLSAGKVLATAGATEDDIKRMVRWLAGQDWVIKGGGVDLKLIAGQHGKWQINGKPDAPPSGRASPSPINRNGAIDGMAKVRELEAKELRAS